MAKTRKKSSKSSGLFKGGAMITLAIFTAVQPETAPITLPLIAAIAMGK